MDYLFPGLLSLLIAVGGLLVNYGMLRRKLQEPLVTELEKTMTAHLDYNRSEIAANLRRIQALTTRLDEETARCLRDITRLETDSKVCHEERSTLQRQLLEVLSKPPRTGGF
jgi:hypothetical protein